jgi:hypothetical protein
MPGAEPRSCRGRDPRRRTARVRADASGTPRPVPSRVSRPGNDPRGWQELLSRRSRAGRDRPPSVVRRVRAPPETRWYGYGGAREAGRLPTPSQRYAPSTPPGRHLRTATGSRRSCPRRTYCRFSCCVEGHDADHLGGRESSRTTPGSRAPANTSGRRVRQAGRVCMPGLGRSACLQPVWVLDRDALNSGTAVRLPLRRDRGTHLHIGPGADRLVDDAVALGGA